VIGFFRKRAKAVDAAARSPEPAGPVAPVEVLVPATAETFDPDLYRLANPDVREAGVDPRHHFAWHGAAEGRPQINPVMVDRRSPYRRDKLARFRDLLDPGIAADAFPLVVGGRHFALADYMSESANLDYEPFVSAIRADPEGRYLDLGCGLRRRVYPNCLYLEVYPSVAADIVVEPTCTYPIRDASLDGIGCFAVLEHTRQPWLVAREIHRMLKPGGRIWIDWPFLQPVHGFPSHYFNATREGLASIFADLGFAIDRAVTEPHQGPDHTLTWILGAFADRLTPETRARFEAMSVAEILRTPPGSPLWAELTADLDDRARAMLACGNCLVATKRG
jgi:SAM-dependent methyltransferase